MINATKFPNDLLLRMIQLTANVALDSKDPDLWHFHALEAQSIRRAIEAEIDKGDVRPLPMRECPRCGYKSSGGTCVACGKNL